MKRFSEYVCQQCGYRSGGFLGKCPQCGEWNSLVESVADSTRISNVKSQISNFKLDQSLVKLSEVKSGTIPRFSSGFAEFDRVLGGGIVPGSMILIAGEPGIGKSTLLLQTAMRIAEGSVGKLVGRQVGKKPTSPQTLSSTLPARSRLGKLEFEPIELVNQLKIYSFCPRLMF